MKLKNMPDINTDVLNGIDLKMIKNLKNSIFGILDPFNYTYVPSKAFSMSFYKKDMLYVMAEFIRPEIDVQKVDKKPWHQSFENDQYEF